MVKIRHFLFIFHLLIIFGISAEIPTILVSFDGMRYDYIEKTNTPNFDSLIKQGVRAKSLIPVFPSYTFPNHYSIATGCYADKHRIIANTFYSKILNKVYSMVNRETVQDSSFYGAEPLWITVQKNGLRSASYFWVGSEVVGKTPSIYKNYDSGIDFTSRIDSVISWFNLPEEKRPDLALLYFNEPDHTGHKFGPESVDVKDIIVQNDQILGYLLNQINTLSIKDDLNLIIVIKIPL